MTFKQHLRQYAERELELTRFMDSEFGPACLEFLEKYADVAGRAHVTLLATVAGASKPT